MYSDDEFEIMKEDIAVCKDLGCDGVVLGILTPEGNADKKRCRRLVEYAYPLGVTFHRAFDRTKDPLQAMEDIIKIGCERILTSGLQIKAIDGVELIKQLNARTDDRIVIMPGSGVNADNIIQLAESTGSVEFHSSASMFANSNMKYENELMNEKLQHIMVDKEEVKKMRALLNQVSSTKL